MVRLAPLLLGVGLAAGKSVELTQPTTGRPAATKAPKTLQFSAKDRQGAVRFPPLPADQQAFQKLQTAYQRLPAAVKDTTGRPAVSINRDSSYHQPSHGYSQPSQSYSQPSHGYSSHGYSSSDGYGYTETESYSGDGGLLGNISKYAAILVPILLVIGLVFLFPSVVNIAGTGRRRRDLVAEEDLDDPSDDLLYRLQTIYESISEDELCTSRLFCELGSVVGDTPYAERIMKYIGFFYPAKNPYMQVMRKAAFADDPRCQLLECDAWKEE